jgi:hypothetical protein
MYIKKALEMEDGTLEIEGKFTPEEVQIILEVGLNTLYKTGALPFKNISRQDAANWNFSGGNA